MKEESKTIRRRHLVWDELRRNGAVSLNRINVKLAAANPPIKTIERTTLYDDIQVLRDLLDVSIEKSPDRDDTTYVLLNNYLASTRHMRSNLNAEKKRTINNILGSLVLAALNGEESSEQFFDVPEIGEKTLSGGIQADLLLDGQGLLAIINKPVELCSSATATPEEASLSGIAMTLRRRVVDMLTFWWRSVRRTICIDAGSSNELFTTNILRQLKLPMPSLFQLSVWTNNVGVFDALIHPPIEGIEAVTVAGTPQSKSGSLGGWLALRSLEALNPGFGMGIIGCTAIVFENNKITFGADSDTDAAMKSEFLSRSSLRIVVADSSKWTDRPYSGYYGFGSPDPQAIHLVITDKVSRGHLIKMLTQGTYILASEII
jgi:DeoR/GlpR family transcriptional regulator of sugar metabolism